MNFRTSRSSPLPFYLCVRIFSLYSGLFVCTRRRFLFINRNRGPGFAGIEDDELDWLIGGESAMNCADGFTQSLTGPVFWV